MLVYILQLILLCMTLEEALKLLKDTDASAAAVVEKELETLKNKGTGVEAERTRADNLKSDLDKAKEDHAKEIADLNAKIEEAKTKGKTDSDGFKSLYEEEKGKAAKLENDLRTKDEEIAGMKMQADKFKENLNADIEALYADIEDEGEKASLKDLAEKYPIEERVNFIVSFKEKYIKKGNKNKGGGPVGGSGAGTVTMEEVQAEYDKLSALPFKTVAQKAALRKAAKILNGEIKLP